MINFIQVGIVLNQTEWLALSDRLVCVRRERLYIHPFSFLPLLYKLDYKIRTRDQWSDETLWRNRFLLQGFKWLRFLFYVKRV